MSDRKTYILTEVDTLIFDPILLIIIVAILDDPRVRTAYLGYDA